MTIVQSVMTMLAQSATPLTLGDASDAMALQHHSIDKAQISRCLSKLMRLGRVSCSKQPGEHVKYFLTPTQMDMHSKGVTKPPIPVPAQIKERPGLNGVAAIDLSKRLRFLTDIGERPAFEGSAVLQEIIGDYRRALNRATGREDLQP